MLVGIFHTWLTNLTNDRNNRQESREVQTKGLKLLSKTGWMNQIYWTFGDSNTQKPEGIHGTGKIHHKSFVD